MEFNTLITKQALGIAKNKDFSDWAESLLVQGSESNSVAILASFGIDRNLNTDEVKQYFEKCLLELNLVLPEPRILIFNHVKTLVLEIINGTVKPQIGLNGLKNFWLQTDNDEPLYRIWDELAEDVATLDDYQGYLWNTHLSKENVDDFIIEVAKQFLQLCELKLPDNFFALCACPDCQCVAKPLLKRIELAWLPEKLFRLLYGRSPTFKWVCRACEQSHLYNMFDYEGRKHYLSTSWNTA